MLFNSPRFRAFGNLMESDSRPHLMRVIVGPRDLGVTEGLRDGAYSRMLRQRWGMV
jgi:hypothetical protein